VRRSLKWSRAASGQVPVDIAEADFAVADPIREALITAVSHSDLGYPDFDSARGAPRRLAEVFADRMRSKFGVPASAERVEICAQVVQALCCAILAFSEPGDWILVHEPTYPPFLRAIGSLGRRSWIVPVPRDDAEEIPDPAALTPPGRLAIIVLCNPHNPTGHLFGDRQLAALATLAEKHQAVIFADEIHQDITYETNHRSIATIDNAIEQTIMFTSASKSFNIPGLRCAVGHFGSSSLHDRFRQLPWHLRSGAGTLGIEATIVAWSACTDWLDAFRHQLNLNRDLVSRAMAGSDCGYAEPQGTFFAWLDLRHAPYPTSASILKATNVALQDGTVFGQGYSGFARLNFAAPQDRLSDALSRVVRLMPISDGRQPPITRALTGGSQR
jgi:cystathionine beta-lyase